MSSAIPCPNCKCIRTKVKDGRMTSRQRFCRRRACERCGTRFNTYESRDESDMSGSKSSYNRRRALLIEMKVSMRAQQKVINRLTALEINDQDRKRS